MHTRRASRHRSQTETRAPRCARQGQPGRYLIVNADDLGADDGTTRGIIAAHEWGVVTSASLMVDMPGAVRMLLVAIDRAGASSGEPQYDDGSSGRFRPPAG